eukprot:Phypoly_transcript_10418.p1 GENE.Phypoly_transcript_10418~~Phypoly_transcript_10418.p1  ORF type:complete len:306 (+),score=18.92 Phypoly_transcript_10418:363-1280(+)
MLWLWKLEKRTCTILCVLLWFGPLVILVGGIVMLSPDTRSIAIGKYNDAIDDWTNTYRDQFASNFININETKSSFNLTANTTPDVLKDKDSRFKTYIPFKYLISLHQLIAPKTWSSPNSTIVNFRINNTIVYFENVTLMQENTITVCCDSGPCTECTSYGATWDGSKCWGTYVLTEFCIKFDEDKGVWGPSRDPGGGYGCGLDGDDWHTQSFAHVNPSSYRLYDFSGNFTVRSARDPYIVAAKLTGGSLNFGLSRAEKLRIGLLLVICGSIFLTPVAIIFVVCCRHMMKKHRPFTAYTGYTSIVN